MSRVGRLHCAWGTGNCNRPLASAALLRPAARHARHLLPCAATAPGKLHIFSATRAEERCCPHRLVVRTSRCGRDNPGSNPGVDILVGWQCCPCLASCCVLPVRWLCVRAHPVSTVPGIEVWCRGADNTVRQWPSAWQGPSAAGRLPLPVTHVSGQLPP